MSRSIPFRTLLLLVAAAAALAVATVAAAGSSAEPTARALPAGLPADVGDRFRIGSITKSLVATVVLQLGTEGRLRLGDSVERWLPGLVPDGRAITIRHLLEHTSGVEDYLNGPTGPSVLERYERNPSYRWAPQRLVRLAVAQPSPFRPGTRWSYSNTGYVLLGMIVERASGRAYGEEIAAPLGLESTFVPAGGMIPGPHAHGYLLPGNVFRPTKRPLDVSRLDPSYASSAGAAVSSAADLDRFLRALVEGRLLGPAQLAKMRTVRTIPGDPSLGYGLGLLRLRTHCGVLWGHNGEIPGYMANAFVSADGRRGFVTLESTSGVPLVKAQARGRVMLAAIEAAVCP